MGARRSTFRIWLLIAAALLVLLLMFFAFVYAQVMGLGGWEPDKSSVYAKRAALIDAQLTIGMSRDAVTAIFQKDTVAYQTRQLGNHEPPRWGQRRNGLGRRSGPLHLRASPALLELLRDGVDRSRRL
jgi:hypothetical protein